MAHLRLASTTTAPPPAVDVAPSTAAVPEQRVSLDDPLAGLKLLLAATGLCMCRECSLSRHPSRGLRVV